MTTNLTHGDHITTTITRPAHGGVGIGDLDGRVVFVRGTYPGDVVEACITQVKKNYAKAALVDIVTPSPLRVPNRCPAAAHGAGCCDFADLKPEAELELKT
ncbi:MAG: TRAM domain-containing protein, partial [Corynebacterium matruchotii]